MYKRVNQSEAVTKSVQEAGLISAVNRGTWMWRQTEV